MNKRGFTLVELITTFALTTVIIVLLINVINVINNIYSKNNIKTELYINQSDLSNILNSKINNEQLLSYETCTDSDFCYTFNFIDGESIKLVVTKKQIKFGNYVYKLMDKTEVKNPVLKEEYMVISDVSHNNTFLILQIPIKNELYPDIDFGINLIYPYNSNNT